MLDYSLNSSVLYIYIPISSFSGATENNQEEKKIKLTNEINNKIISY